MKGPTVAVLDYQTPQPPSGRQRRMPLLRFWLGCAVAVLSMVIVEICSAGKWSSADLAGIGVNFALYSAVWVMMLALGRNTLERRCQEFLHERHQLVSVAAGIGIVGAYLGVGAAVHAVASVRVLAVTMIGCVFLMPLACVWIVYRKGEIHCE